MNKILNHVLLVAIISITAATPVPAAVRCVSAASASPAPPYTSWATAARTIQEAIDAAADGDEIVVTNGIYRTGGRVVEGAITNRVAVTKPLTVRSVNGPGVTVIEGFPMPEWPFRDRAVRCVYLADGATLAGFTLTNGAAYSGGGVWCASTGAVMTNCVFSGNSASFGDGGGAYRGTLNHCTLAGNQAYFGGGAYGSVLNHCTLADNSATFGGWASAGTLNNCLLNGNSATYNGGAVYFATVNNCNLSGNSARGYGGGAYGGTLTNCTLTRNTAYDGGGVYDGRLNNCIVQFNMASLGFNPNHSGGTLSYSCTTPLPTSGVGNLEVDPQLASASHLSAGSPCRGAGSAAFTSGADIDGEAWADPPSIGCDEYREGAVTGLVTVAIRANYTAVVPGFAVDFEARIDGRVSASRWKFGDETVVSNRPFTTHSWASVGDYPVVLRAWNESYPEGVRATMMVRVVVAPVHYVATNSSSPVAPYLSWATAATNIQDAVDAVTVPGAVVLVSDGVYQSGGRAVQGANDSEWSRVAVTKPLTVRSVNGPKVTVIRGDEGIRCAYLSTGGTLVGFTLTDGVADYGAGVWCESIEAVVSNCLITGNRAEEGGGVYGGTLNNCILTGNSADGGGGGGAAYGTLNNCIAYYNTGDRPNYARSSLNHCCTTPVPFGGAGNITDAPLFENFADGNLRLQTNSPCVDAGHNAYAPGSADLDGCPRIVGGTVDIGAYEFHGAASGLSSPLTVKIRGRGTVNPDLNGRNLIVRENYTMTARPAEGFVFVNWSGGVTSIAPELTFEMQSNLVLEASFADVAPPVVTITPSASATPITGATTTVHGTASDNDGVALVMLQVGSGPFLPAAGTTNWTAMAKVQPGINSIRAKAIDFAGNESEPVEKGFFFLASPLMLTTHGMGKVGPHTNGQALVLGKRYTVKATPGPGNLFSHWSGTFSSARPTFSFAAVPDTTLTAHFVTNLFPELKGHYTGLLCDPTHPAHENGGCFSFNLSGGGAFSGRLTLAGKTRAISGRFGPDRYAHRTIARPPPKPPLAIDLQLGPEPDSVSGTVSTGSIASRLTGYRAPFSTTNPATSFAGRYTMLLSGVTNAEVSPSGEGFVTLIVAPNGRVRLAGALADNTPLAQSCSLSADGSMPLYSSLYRSGGSCFGWVTLLETPLNDIHGGLLWSKPSGCNNSSNPSGFADEVRLLGSRYAATNRPVLALSNAVVILEGGDLFVSTTNDVLLNARNRVRVAPPNPDKLSITLSLPTGTFRGGFTHPATSQRSPVKGVLLQKQNRGGGFFPRESESGSVYLGLPGSYPLFWK